MAILNSWQKITRVLPGLPFGDGADGAYSSATLPPQTQNGCAGTIGTKTVSLIGTGPANGDIVLIWQTRGTGAGQWEINRVASGGGTSTLTMQHNLVYGYSLSGYDQAFTFVVKRYTTVAGLAGTWQIPDWTGSTNGFAVFAANVSTVLACTVTGLSCGFRGGALNRQGEGTVADNAGNAQTANGNGGGAANANGQNAGGGGGGNLTSGAHGNNSGSGIYGDGGNTSSTSDLRTMTFGGGGGGGDGSASPGVGADGGGGFMCFTRTFAFSGSGNIVLSGGDGASGSVGNQGGSGAGGPCGIICNTATLGATKIVSVGGVPWTPFGDGGTGPIAVHHAGAVTGTTNPTFTDVVDPTLSLGSAGLLFF